jgi:putative GTP pyrophosphokinase
VYRVLGRYDLSLKDFDSAIQINSAPFESFWGRAQTCYEMQLYSRALQDCEKVLSLQNDFSPAQELKKIIQGQMF